MLRDLELHIAPGGVISPLFAMVASTQFLLNCFNPKLEQKINQRRLCLAGLCRKGPDQQRKLSHHGQETRDMRRIRRGHSQRSPNSWRNSTPWMGRNPRTLINRDFVRQVTWRSGQRQGLLLVVVTMIGIVTTTSYTQNTCQGISQRENGRSTFLRACRVKGTHGVGPKHIRSELFSSRNSSGTPAMHRHEEKGCRKKYRPHSVVTKRRSSC